MDDLKDWIEANRLNVKFISKVLLEIEGVGKFLLIKPKEGKIFDEHFRFELSDVEQSLANKCDFFLFKFGGKFYYHSVIKEQIELNPFKYLGKAVQELEMDFTHLGIHGKYEILNGSRDYEDWIKKAKFLGITSLGICEKNTLAGTLSFQMDCVKKQIKPILGETITVAKDPEAINKYDVKVFALNQEGWSNILRINKCINVDNDKFIDEPELLKLGSGLVIIFSNSENLSTGYINKFHKAFDKCFMQIDTMEYLSNEKDKEQLTNLKNYFDKYYKKLEPILINDSYYLDKEDAHIKKILNKIQNGVSHNQSKDQYFKSVDDSFGILASLFTDKSSLDIIDLTQQIVDNTAWISNNSNATIELGKLHLPQYEMTDEEKTEHGDQETLFFSLLQRGFDVKIAGNVDNEQEYLDRIETEVEVIASGGFIPYFLILWDILRFCNKENILYGPGRGSSAGSLVAYLLGIVNIDPIHYGLLFERFLNKSRIASGLPDIDTDFMGTRREEVKRYMEEKYGIDYVTSIGTYGNMKLKSAIKDLAKEVGLDFKKTNYITSTISDIDETNWSELFKCASSTAQLKDFIQNNRDLINNVNLCINQPRNASIHASAVVIVPKVYNDKSLTIYDWMPVKKIDGVLVSEWEGEFIEKKGFLKCDILGLRQLDKFFTILNLIETHQGKKIDLNKIDLTDQKVYDLFKAGLNEDVFQFGTSGLKGYCMDVKPDSVDELANISSLYRPGAMSSNSHNLYVKVKFGHVKPEYDYGLKEVTEKTHGIYIYQEQIILAVQLLGGLSLAEADNVRKAMGKKDQKLMDSYKDQFVKGAISKGCSEIEAIKIWNKIEGFAGYSFNKSHSVAYSVMGYWSQWLKYHYPVAFWTASLKFANDDEISSRISEINKLGGITIAPPDINNSIDDFKPDFKNNKIYWSITSIKFVGPVAVEKIIEERTKNGLFFSFEEFFKRIDTGKVNGRSILNLILSGAFDEIEKIKRVQDRFKLVKKLAEYREESVSEDFSKDLIMSEHFWIIKQFELSGLGYIDYSRVCNGASTSIFTKKYVDSSEILSDSLVNKEVAIGGMLMNVIERKSKNGVFGQLELQSNSDKIYCTVWNETYEQYKEDLKTANGKIILIYGKVVADAWKKCNVIQTLEKSIIEII